MKESVPIDNVNGIELNLCHTQITVTDCKGDHPGDDNLLLVVPDAEDYDTDLIQDGAVILHFTKSQARRLARRLWQMAGAMKTAEQRTTGIP